MALTKAFANCGVYGELVGVGISIIFGPSIFSIYTQRQEVRNQKGADYRVVDE